MNNWHYNCLLLFGFIEESEMDNILIVTHDENLINFTMRDYIRLKFRFVHCSNIFQGLKRIAEEDIGFLIYDVTSSSLNILQAIKMAKKLKPNLHIIIITDDESILRNKNLDLKIIDFIQFKPPEFDQLEQNLYLYSTVWNKKKSKEKK